MTAFNAVANGGDLIQPHIVKEITSVNENGTIGYINARMKESQTSNNSILGTNIVNILGGTNSRSGNTLTSNMITSLSGDKDITVYSFGRLIRFPNSGIEDFGNEQIYKESATSNTITIKSDSQAPNVSEKPSSNWTKDNVSINLNATDSRSGVKSSTLYKGATQVATGTGNVNYTESSEGVHEFKISTSDNVGNVKEEKFTIKIDKTAPSITGKPSSDWTKDNVLINLNADDGNGSGVKSITLYKGTTQVATGKTLSLIHISEPTRH